MRKSDGLVHFSSKTIDSQEVDLARALNKISPQYTSAEERDAFLKEMEGFKELFSKFKSSKGKQTIEWEKIKVSFVFLSTSGFFPSLDRSNRSFRSPASA